MRRRTAPVAIATAIFLGGAIALAGPAAAGPDNADDNSAWYCATNPGQHKATGISNANPVGGGVGVQRNVGGRCI